LQKLDQRRLQVDKLGENKYLIKNINYEEVTPSQIEETFKSFGKNIEILPTGEVLVTEEKVEDCCDSCLSGEECIEVKKIAIINFAKKVAKWLLIQH
jgi:RNA recognition motif-containing protein